MAAEFDVVAAHFAVERLGVLYDVLVDEADLAFVQQHRWFLGKNGYVYRNLPMRNYVRGGARYLHRELLGLEAGDGTHVDHLNRNRLDNRRGNLRPGPPWQNAQNQGGHRDAVTSSYRGVSYCRTHGVWKATHMYRGVSWTKNCASEMEALAAVTAHRREVLGG